MSDDLNLNRDDFEDCFADAPPPVSVSADLARGQHHLRRRRRIIGGAVGGVVAIAVIAVPILTSQASRPVFDPALPPSVQPSTTAPPSVQPTATCSPATIKTADAIKDPDQWPITDQKRVPREEKGEKVSELGVASTGEALLEVGRDAKSVNDVMQLFPGRLYLEDPATGRRTQVRGESDLHDGTQTFATAADQDFVVWVETPDTSVGASTWEMYAFDRRTEKISLVATSEDEPEHGITPDPVPRLWNGSVYWHEGRENPAGGDSMVINIYARKLGGDDPTRQVVKNAGQPAPTDGWLYYLRWDPAHPEGRYAVYRKSLTGNRTELVHEDSTKDGSGLVAIGETSAWTEGDDVVVYRGSELIARIVPTKDHTAFARSAADGAIGLTSNNAGDEDYSLLLDLRSGCRLFQLARADGLASVDLGGGTISWSANDPDSETGGGLTFRGRLR